MNSGHLTTGTSLVGMWRLQSFTVQDADGRVLARPMGRRPQGLLVYTPDGLVSTLLVDPDRIGSQSPSVPGSADVEDVVRTSPSISYVATVTMRGDHVIHHVLFSSVAAWTGTRQEPAVRLDADTLTLCPPPQPDHAGTRAPVLTWQRISRLDEPHVSLPARPGDIDLRAGRCHYLSWGAEREGIPCAVLLHGNAGSAMTWSRVAPVLACRYRVFAPDLRGHGHSTRPPAYALRQAADDIRHFLDALHLSRPLIVGHSWGAAIALVLGAAAETADAPPRLSGLVLEDLPPTMAFSERDILQLQRLTATDPATARATLLAARAAWHPADIDAMVHGLQHADPATVRAIVDHGSASGSLLPLLARVHAPVLLLRADPRHGGVLTDADWALARSQLPADSTALDLPGAAHTLHYDRFADFMTALTAFTTRLR